MDAASGLTPLGVQGVGLDEVLDVICTKKPVRKFIFAKCSGAPNGNTRWKNPLAVLAKTPPYSAEH